MQVGLGRAGFTSTEATFFFDRMDQDGSDELEEKEFCDAFRIVLEAADAHGDGGIRGERAGQRRGVDAEQNDKVEELVDEFSRPIEQERSSLPDDGG